ncbi:MAG: DUF167 domain-containing protein [Candidatus Diapherotrites archaeon]|nr:DUF167 domain-containing protein [Candidatus Diapherotrites archaeon]
MQTRVLYIKVIPNAKEFRILEEDELTGEMKIKTKRPAINGRANQELIQELEKKFKQKITIIKGHKSNRKIIKLG